mmetsp:Transcript_126426/g.357569  ORF Transcript_126426/g.357569 Transcript_126426/m.357569 type:complete len:294 (-) Transcript_126426:8-889(-)
MVVPSSVAFSNGAGPRWTIPVKNTFIDFDVPSHLPKTRFRATSSPPSYQFTSATGVVVDWDAATQELCHAMTPMQFKVAPKLPNHQSHQRSKESDPCDSPKSQPCASACVACEVSPRAKQGSPGTEVDAISDVSTKASDNNVEAPVHDEAGMKWTSVPGKKNKKLRNSDLVPTRASKSQSQYSSSRDDNSQWSGKGKGLPHFKRIEVGIEDDNEFRVVQKLIGPRGKHIQDITTESVGSKVWIIGKGSRSWEDAVGPLTICVGATSNSGFETAVGLVSELLERVRDDHRKHQK